VRHSHRCSTSVPRSHSRVYWYFRPRVRFASSWIWRRNSCETTTARIFRHAVVWPLVHCGPQAVAVPADRGALHLLLPPSERGRTHWRRDRPRDVPHCGAHQTHDVRKSNGRSPNSCLGHLTGHRWAHTAATNPAAMIGILHILPWVWRTGAEPASISAGHYWLMSPSINRCRTRCTTACYGDTTNIAR